MIGIDIVEVERIKDIYQRHGLLLLEKLLDQQEINELPIERNRSFFIRLSCYIASKEAIYKAYVDEDLGWKDIIIRNIAEKPLIYIKKSDVTNKIKLAFALSKEIVISQALMICQDEGYVSAPACHGASSLQLHLDTAFTMIEEIDA